jgi:uncharacterized protein (TIGR04222 family)
MFNDTWWALCRLWNAASDAELLAAAAAVIVAQFVAARRLRRLLRWPYSPPMDAVTLSPYELAYFIGGAQRVFHVALGNLLRRGVLTLHVRNHCGDSKLAVEHPLPAEAPQVERDVYDAVAARSGQCVEQVFKPGALEPRFAEHVLRQFPGIQAIHHRLVDARLVLSGQQFDMACGAPIGLSGAFVISLMVCVIKLAESGGERRIDGIATVILVALSFALIAALAGLGPFHQTVRGEGVCNQLRQELAVAQGVIASITQANLSDEEFVTFAAVGSAWLWRQPPLAELEIALRWQPAESSGY